MLSHDELKAKFDTYEVKDPEIKQLIMECKILSIQTRTLYRHLENYTDLFVEDTFIKDKVVEYPLSRVKTIRMACRRLPEIIHYLKLKDAELQGVNIYE